MFVIASCLLVALSIYAVVHYRGITFSSVKASEGSIIEQIDPRDPLKRYSARDETGGITVCFGTSWMDSSTLLVDVGVNSGIVLSVKRVNREGYTIDQSIDVNATGMYVLPLSSEIERTDTVRVVHSTLGTILCPPIPRKP